MVVLVNSFRQDHQLVVENYYQEDLAYQKKYDRLLNTQNLKTLPLIKFDQKSKTAVILFGDEDLGKSGTILFYCPTDNKKDKTISFEMAVNDVELNFPALNLAKGKWLVKLNWTQNKTDYYYEDQLLVF